MLEKPGHLLILREKAGRVEFGLPDLSICRFARFRFR